MVLIIDILSYFASLDIDYYNPSLYYFLIYIILVIGFLLFLIKVRKELNLYQHIIAIVTLFFFCLMFIFPPWNLYSLDVKIDDLGYRMIFAQQSLSYYLSPIEPAGSRTMIVDIKKLLIQFLVISSLSLYLLYLTRSLKLKD